jgi:proline dehydrogenase
MLRNALLYLSAQPTVFKFVRNNGIAKKFARRFVAGETADEALDAVKVLNAKGITASLDLLGESVHNEAEARASGRDYIRLLDQIRQRNLDANVSVKLTAMGLDISEELCISIMHEVLDRARQHRTFVRLDMESSAYTERTLQLFEQRLYPAYPENVGIVLQSYLYRTAADVERAIQLKCRVRLCKGAYKEPASVAYQSRMDVDKSYVRCLRVLMEGRGYPMVATHDPRLIGVARKLVLDTERAKGSYEFQMLYGIRPNEQRRLAADGETARIYVPYGDEWYGYLMRRLAERPSNVAFFLRALATKG